MAKNYTDINRPMGPTPAGPGYAQNDDGDDERQMRSSPRLYATSQQRTALWRPEDQGGVEVWPTDPPIVRRMPRMRDEGFENPAGPWWARRGSDPGLVREPGRSIDPGIVAPPQEDIDPGIVADHSSLMGSAPRRRPGQSGTAAYDGYGRRVPGVEINRATGRPMGSQPENRKMGLTDERTWRTWFPKADSPAPPVSRPPGATPEEIAAYTAAAPGSDFSFRTPYGPVSVRYPQPRQAARAQPREGATPPVSAPAPNAGPQAAAPESTDWVAKYAPMALGPVFPAFAAVDLIRKAAPYIKQGVQEVRKAMPQIVNDVGAGIREGVSAVQNGVRSAVEPIAEGGRVIGSGVRALQPIAAPIARGLYNSVVPLPVQAAATGLAREAVKQGYPGRIAPDAARFAGEAALDPFIPRALRQLWRIGDDSLKRKAAQNSTNPQQEATR